MNPLKLLVFLLIFTNTFSQKPKIEKISISYNNSARIGHMSKVYIVLSDNKLYGDKTVTVYITIDEENKNSFEISKEIFNKFIVEVLKIKPKDVILNNSNLYPMDAPTTSLSFGDYERSVTYSVYGLSKEDENTSRKKMLKIVQRILEIGNIKIPGIN